MPRLQGKEIHPNVADLHGGNTHQSAPDVGEHGVRQVVAYCTVCVILDEKSTATDMACDGTSVAVFYRCELVTLGFSLSKKDLFDAIW